MLRFLGLIFAAIFGVFGFLLSAAQMFCEAAARSLGVAPTVPPADDDGELEELASEEIALQAGEDLNSVRKWASATIYRRPFKLPDNTIGGWLSALDERDAARIARADGAGVLDLHIAGRELFPGLPPVGDAAATRRWCERNRPVNRKRATVAEYAPAPDVVDEPEHDAEVYSFPRAA